MTFGVAVYGGFWQAVAVSDWRWVNGGAFVFGERWNLPEAHSTHRSVQPSLMRLIINVNYNVLFLINFITLTIMIII